MSIAQNHVEQHTHNNQVVLQSAVQCAYRCVLDVVLCLLGMVSGNEDHATTERSWAPPRPQVRPNLHVRQDASS
eukprot:2747500-Amphidinium_carterae.1